MAAFIERFLVVACNLVGFGENRLGFGFAEHGHVCPLDGLLLHVLVRLFFVNIVVRVWLHGYRSIDLGLRTG